MPFHLVQELQATAKVRINPTRSILRLLDNGDVVALVPFRVKAFMECPTHPLPAGFLPAKVSRLVDLEVPVRGIALDTRLYLYLKGLKDLKDLKDPLACPVSLAKE